MPAKFTMESLPIPPADITLTQMQPRRVAAVRFNGSGADADLAVMENNLMEWVAERELTPVGDFEYAFYDAPMVPARMRRNEVMIEVVAQ